MLENLRQARFMIPITRLVSGLRSWSLVQRFTFTSALIMLLGMAGIGWWVGQEIETNVIKEATAQTALYMDGFVSPNIQELNAVNTIAPEHFNILNDLFSKDNLGARIVSVKIWSRDGLVIYSNFPDLIGRKFDDLEDQEEAWNGKATGQITNLVKAENVEERLLSLGPLFEIYSPIYLNGTHQIIAVAESYQSVDVLELEIQSAQRWGWLMVGGVMTAIYLVLVGFVNWAGKRIYQQQLKLKDQAAQLAQLLNDNKELTKRVRIAAANTIALNESLFRRISAELHDGPMQEIGMALYQYGFAIKRAGKQRSTSSNAQSLLQAALQELRAIAARLAVPQLEEMPLASIVDVAVDQHELRTGTKVELKIEDIPEQASLPTKITVYRFIQEGLNNAFRHANGLSQSVTIARISDDLRLEVSDQGPGFDSSQPWADHLGLAGIHEHVESLDGHFVVDSKIGSGTKLIAQLPLAGVGNRMTDG